MRDVWRCAGVRCGGQCVIAAGQYPKLRWCADSLVTLVSVSDLIDLLLKQTKKRADNEWIVFVDKESP